MLTVTQVANKAGIALNTARNYPKWYPDLFSEDARGLHGHRRFNDDDVAAICTLVALKNTGMSLDDAAERLRSQASPPVIDVGATPLQQASTNAQEAQGDANALQVLQGDMLSRFEAIERRQDTQDRKRDVWLVGTGIWIGIILMAAIFFAVGLLNSWWFSGG